MTLPLLQEALDLFVFLLMAFAATCLYAFYPPLWILPATAFVHIFLFSPVISDSCLGLCVGPCRYDAWIHRINEWHIIKRK